MAALLMKVVILATAVFSNLIFITFATKGTATFYTQLLPSACFGMKKEGVMIAAASSKVWKGGAVCGTKVRVKCTGATNEGPHPCRGSRSSVLVRIVDFCPDCPGTSLDLSRQAFSKIANPDAGEIKIQFHQV